MQTLTLDETGRLGRQIQQASGDTSEMIAVTDGGKPVLAVIPWEVYTSLLETLEILSDPEQIAAFRAGVAEMEAGQAKPLDQALADLGWTR